MTKSYRTFIFYLNKTARKDLQASEEAATLKRRQLDLQKIYFLYFPFLEAFCHPGYGSGSPTDTDKFVSYTAKKG